MSFLVEIVDNLEDILANSEAFRTWCGAASIAEAEARIFGFDETTEAAKPAVFAVIPDVDPWSWERIAEGTAAGPSGFALSEEIEIQFFQDLGTAKKSAFTEAAARAFLQAMSDIALDILETAADYGVRISSMYKVSYSEDFLMRTQNDDGGNVGYQYRIAITTRT